MKRSCFNQEQVQRLKKNSNTAFVSQSSIRFTDDFREKLWEAIASGQNPADVFIKAGYSLDDIGDRRITNLVNSVTREKADSLSNSSKDDEIKRLTSEMKALRHELDTLKKLSNSPTRGISPNDYRCSIRPVRAHFRSGQRSRKYAEH